MGKRHKSHKDRIRARKIRLAILTVFLLVVWQVLRVDYIYKAIEVAAVALLETLLGD
jgi:hypothetical protein